MNKTKVSIILPTFNEKPNIIELIKKINDVVNVQKEIIVVDDNSPDGTSDAVEKLIKKNVIPSLKLEKRMSDHGLTKSIWHGIEVSKGDIIVWMDCDFSHPPELIPSLLEKIEEGYDIAVASRFIKGGGFKKNLKNSEDSLLAVFLSRIMNYSIQLLLDSRFRDYTSGFIAIRRKVFKNIKLQGDYGEYFIDLMVRAILLGYKFVEIPFVNLPRKYGESKTGSSISTLVKRGKNYIIFSIRLFLIKLGYSLGIQNDIKSQTQRFK